VNVEELLTASDVLLKVAERLRELPEHREEAVAACLHLQLASLVVGELAYHLQRGVEPYEAMRRTAVGEMPIPPEKATMLRLLTAMALSKGKAQGNDS
jgi:hypothetical protein